MFPAFEVRRWTPRIFRRLIGFLRFFGGAAGVGHQILVSTLFFTRKHPGACIGPAKPVLRQAHHINW